jgi:hypothetical protein
LRFACDGHVTLLRMPKLLKTGDARTKREPAGVRT